MLPVQSLYQISLSDIHPHVKQPALVSDIPYLDFLPFTFNLSRCRLLLLLHLQTSLRSDLLFSK